MGNTEADCQALLEHLYLFLDDELGEDECASLQRHLDECGECLRHVDFERAIKEVVRTKCAESLPEGLLARIRSSLRAQR